MNVLVIGGAGFIGSHTVDALLARGHEVRVLDSLTPPVHTGARPAHLAARVELIRAGITDRRALRSALTGIDAVFNFAAYQDYLTDFAHFFVTNSVGTALLYEIIINERLPVRKIVMASSQAVYGEGAYRCAEHGAQHPGARSRAHLERGDWDVRCPVCARPLEPVPTDERLARPQTSYGLSKRDQEDIALTLGRQYGIPSVALRYSIVQGPRQSFRNAYSGALRSFTVRALCGRPPVLFEDGGQIRDYVSIHDVVRANLLVFDDSRADCQVFNVGGNRRVTVRELAGMVLDVAGVAVEPEAPGIYRVGDTRHIFSDVSSLRLLGWQPVVPQNEIVREYVAWAAAEPDLHDTFEEAQQRMIVTGVLQPRKTAAVGA